ncbi:THY1 Predicted alternative thymidylate synthase [uncultured Caudovirales phage]|uniref:THY1 Predicted alternative thymidylate synthase n=1 Tax=uncultured Caudovirales phage TaxID=2100421 RepID=A0A6J5KUI6_9CAUD|nr:THY1 Predicted alternative thymidylate synthase [uncultured Caudovirales phage]
MTNISVDYIDHMGSDLSVVNSARVSFDKSSNWACDPLDGSKRLTSGDTKLISYLARHNHKSPFNHAFATFRVKAPIFVARQLVKHEYMPWNEVSRRYVDSEPEFYKPLVWRKRADNVKQGSSDEVWVDSDVWNPRSYMEAFKDYEYLLDEGVCPEQARMVLPQSMMTEWIWSGSLFAIAKMCKLRLDSHTQYETRLVALKIAQKMADLYPVSWKALMDV